MLVEGPIFQLCWVVDDIAGAERWFTPRNGVESWMRIPDVPFSPGTFDSLVPEGHRNPW